MPMNEPILITGATSSIARAIATRFAEEGRDIILSGRNLEEVKKTAADLRIRYQVKVESVKFDALDDESHPAFVRECLEKAVGKLGGVVVCHGYMADQEQAQKNDFGESHKMVQTNFTSVVSILNLLANHFEEQKSGFICAISSVAGDRGRGSNYIYGSTKAGLDAYLQGLRNRLYPSGVPVTTIKPGFVDTRMTWGLPKLFLVASPEKVAGDIYNAIQKKKSVVYTPWFWWNIMTIICNIPEFMFKRMKL